MLSKYLEPYNEYIQTNINVAYIRKNLINVLFQLWYSPYLCYLFMSGGYYENNNYFVLNKYICIYELVNVFLEFFIIHPYNIRSLLLLHHLLSFTMGNIVRSYHNENIELINICVHMANITISTNLLLDMVQIFHKNVPLKVIFMVYYFVIRIIYPLPYVYNVATGYYLQTTSSKYTVDVLSVSVGLYMFYGLNLFWFYKLCRIARKQIINSRHTPDNTH